MKTLDPLAPPAVGRRTSGALELENQRSAWVVVAMLLVFAGLYALVAKVLLRRFPFSGDEYATLLQAELFARGHLHVNAPENADLLRVDHVIIDGWVRSKYPPGASAMLALGGRARVCWLITPIEAVVALALVWHSARRSHV